MSHSTSVVVNQCIGCQYEGYSVAGPLGEAISEEIDGRKFRQPEYSIRECARCGLLYRSPVLSAEEFGDYYATKNFRDWETPGLFPTERAVLTVLRALPHGAKVLDFGCSSGRLLAELGNGYDRYGVEINQEAATVAASKGIKMVTSEAFDALEPSFDAVVLVDVFEHLTTPTEQLAKLTRILKPGGILVVVTGDGDNRICRLNPADFWYFLIIEHVGMLTKRYAEWLCGQLKLELKAWQRVSHYDPKWPSTVEQWSRQFSYWQFRTGRPIVRGLLRMIPWVRNAESRDKPPIWQFSADHVVAVFSKLRTP
ncbi:MAG TPA: methyltransferase domain-containing protein [Candidatus Didemnitutus sp.]|nr:methyltransferase domain-containing protein [Candidatus Didemnitutus sp.]